MRWCPGRVEAKVSGTRPPTSEPGPGSCFPGQGIYAGVAELEGGTRYVAAIDVGTNPTFGTEPLHVEAFLLDFPDDELRGDTLTVGFWERLRDEVKFDSVDELVAAIADDVERTRAVIRCRTER